MNFSHVLISRPETEARQLAASLADTGLEVVVMPAFRFGPQQADIDFAAGWPAAGRRLAVFASPRAVEFGLRQLPTGFLREARVAAIGPATARALEQAGEPVALLPEQVYDSESLLQAPELADAPGVAIIFTAPGGRRALQTGLAALGWSVHMAHVYRRIALAAPVTGIKKLNSARRIISVWTSGNAMQALAEALPPQTWEKVLAGAWLVTSARLAEQARALGSRATEVTEGPGNDRIRESITRLLVNV
ncbi:MAG: hypothetical protein GTN86_09365 [Xanthomonadales bacterium]|nr:hypothetical protein [Xanthomonadales bacterium]NIN60092.1 hypothetical protein [Xanthomonadales bacterium]NIN75462.1 hypothetical protein [Xanthomonadales bacterium]NIO13558.1 hypothetical protein [Xanthomonadales bacterium]NIP12485.1 hypothetical protein [Xanthomonadales bacterium]